MKVTFNTQSTNQYYAKPSFHGVPKNVLKTQPDVFTKTAPKAAVGILGTLAAVFGIKNTESAEEAELRHFVNQQLDQGLYGEIPMHRADLETMIDTHEKLRKYPKVLEQIHLTKNFEGKIPMHYAKDGEAAEIGRVFKDRPDVLKKIYLTKNKKGKTPLYYATPDMITDVFTIFKDEPSTLKKILLVKNKRDKYPIHDMGEKEIALAHLELLNYPDILVKLFSPDSVKKFNDESVELVQLIVKTSLLREDLSSKQKEILRKSRTVLNDRIIKLERQGMVDANSFRDIESE